jgi:uncharacterized membrane protein
MNAETERKREKNKITKQVWQMMMMMIMMMILMMILMMMMMVMESTTSNCCLQQSTMYVCMYVFWGGEAMDSSTL